MTLQQDALTRVAKYPIQVVLDITNGWASGDDIERPPNRIRVIDNTIHSGYDTALVVVLTHAGDLNPGSCVGEAAITDCTRCIFHT
jgi:hypothetical protein